MQEEFHGIYDPRQYQLLYGWNTLNANVWLPSVSELVGYNPNTYDDLRGTYFSAMKGLNASTSYWTDSKGGVQFTYFKQFNASGGGEKIWNMCSGEETWLHSPSRATTTHAWRVTTATDFNHALVVSFRAVHPAVSSEQVLYDSLFSEGSSVKVSLLDKLTAVC